MTPTTTAATAMPRPISVRRRGERAAGPVPGTAGGGGAGGVPAAGGGAVGAGVAGGTTAAGAVSAAADASAGGAGASTMAASTPVAADTTWATGGVLTACPQLGQNRAAGPSGAPQCAHATGA